MEPYFSICMLFRTENGYFYCSLSFWLILRAWDSLSNATRCRSLVIVYDSKCILQIGVAAVSSSDDAVLVDANKLMQGSLYQDVTKSGSRKQHQLIAAFSSLLLLCPFNVL